MDISFWKIFAIFGVVCRWAEKALADGRVTLTEALELVGELAVLLGVTTLFELPLDDNTEPRVVAEANTVIEHDS